MHLFILTVKSLKLKLCDLRASVNIPCVSQRLVLSKNIVCEVQHSSEQLKMTKYYQSNDNSTATVKCKNTSFLWKKTLWQSKVRPGERALQEMTENTNNWRHEYNRNSWCFIFHTIQHCTSVYRLSHHIINNCGKSWLLSCYCVLHLLPHV